jgi:uncharacterized membrane protein YkvA (DUF1232 family)
LYWPRFPVYSLSQYDIHMELKDWARAIKHDAHAVYLAARDPRVPWYTKALALCVAGYALSLIDLIPDFIPVIGYLDDLSAEYMRRSKSSAAPGYER